MARRVKTSKSGKATSANKPVTRRQSPEIAGGAGFTFEGEAAALYLAALLAEESAPALEPYIVTKVALQQRGFGEPLDDIIIDGESSERTTRRLSLQAKSSLRVSAAASNSDFREVVTDSWRTLKKDGFREGIDRFGVITRNISEESARALQSLSELARASPSASSFEERYEATANLKVRQIRKVIETLLTEIAAAEASEVHSFLAHFVLIRLDALHEGATSVNGTNSARAALAADAADRAPDLFDRLRVIARQGASRSASFDRPSLVLDLSARFPLIGSRRLGPAVEQLTTLASRAANEIEDTVAGVRLDRATARAKLADELSRNRFVQIHGLPGAGKSALIRRTVQDAIQKGATLFLKSDRLDGVGWAGYSQKQGIPQAEISDLLIEIGAQGTAILFIDGLDRIDRAHRSIVLDVIQAVFDDERLSGWRVVATVRDAGIEPLRTWLPRSVFAGGIGSVPVEALDDEEAEALAIADPSLRPLLFGQHAIREIARRPFFTKIVSQSLKAGQHTDNHAPQSEVDLANGWWERGGYDTSGRDALERQRALINLAGVRAEHLNEPIPMRALQAGTLGTVESLKSDGILQSISIGHSVQFAHDIFFEWAFLHRLIDLGDEWQKALADAGEPPVLGRVVELLSQSALPNFEEWRATLLSLEASSLRSQWLRAWLLAPVSMPDFGQVSARYWDVLAQDNCRLLQKAFVWFQAERTSPNVVILEGAAGSKDFSSENRILAADLLGWPSDFNTWRRLIHLVDSHVDEIPASLYSHVVSIFEVWQNALADIQNPVSSLIISRASGWLVEIEENDRKPERRNPLPPPWRGLEKGRGQLRTRLQQIVLRAARAFPDEAGAYMRRLLAKERMRDESFKQLVAFAPVLSETHPDLLADVTLKYLREELPEDRLARQRREREESAKLREAIRAKPESERTREDELFLDSPHHFIGRGSDWHDWDRLAIKDEFFYFPASPLREPFHSLFLNAAETGLRLVRDLSNHAMDAWRQLHRLGQRGTPIPIKLVFPWGGQQFWGTTREYLWARGHWAPKPLASAYLALDSWARRQIDEGREADSVIQEILVGNDSIASLGAAVCVALRTWAVSDVTRPLLHCARLWRADLQRFVEESGFKISSQIGFWPKDRTHAQATELLNSDPVRQRELRQLVAMDVLQSETARSNSMLDVIRAFAEDLPFEFEEDESDQEVHQALEKAAAVDVEWFKAENYHLVQTEMGEDARAITFVNPQAQTEESRARLAEGQRHLNAFTLFHWGERSFEAGLIDEALSVEAAVGLARQYDHVDAFSESSRQDPQASMERGALAATAAVVLAFASDDGAHLEWARGILNRASEMPEAADEMWLSQSITPWHPGIFVARAAAAEFRKGVLQSENAERLLRLVAHPLECVGLEAISLSFGLWSEEPRFAWCAFCLAFGICHLPPREEIFRTGYGRTPSSIIEDRAENVRVIISAWVQPDQWPELPLPSPAWLKMGTEPELADRGEVHSSEDSFDDEFQEHELREDENVGWREPRGIWNDQFAAKIIAKIPVMVATRDATKDRLTAAFENLLGWTIDKLAPAWEAPPFRRSSDANIFEWTHALAGFLGEFAGCIDRATLDERFLTPICAIRDEPCFSLLASLTDRFICAHILDSAEISSNADLVLDRSTDRVLQIRELQPDTYRAGELHGFDIPLLARALLFISVERATGAARYVNGDWREIAFIMPTVDRIVRAAGWSATIMTDFLTLCERARAYFPADNFADDVQRTIEWGEDRLSSWQTTMIPGRIAGLIQHFSERDAPLDVNLARKLLRILDALVDMGDRRSAALQTSVAFRDVRLQP